MLCELSSKIDGCVNGIIIVLVRVKTEKAVRCKIETGRHTKGKQISSKIRSMDRSIYRGRSTKRQVDKEDDRQRRRLTKRRINEVDRPKDKQKGQECIKLLPPGQVYRMPGLQNARSTESQVYRKPSAKVHRKTDRHFFLPR